MANARIWLIAIRKNHQLTQAQAAKKCGISRSHFAQIESGQRNPSVKVAKRIAVNLNFHWVIFFEFQLHDMCSFFPEKKSA